jgi:hypothetical protein
MLPFFEALEKTRVATAIQGTTWFMPLANTIHALGMTLLLGSIIVISLRLIGVVMATRPVSLIAREIWPWTIIGLSIMLATGFLLFLPESVRWYGSIPFRVKMTFLLLAIVFHFTLFRKVTQGDGTSSLLRRATGALALALWFAVGWGGRAITFLE